MPYIDPSERHRFDDHVDALGAEAKQPGELAYIIARLLHVYIYENSKDESYASLAEALAVLETCKFEYYLETLKPYEVYKARVNGDLFDHDGNEVEAAFGDNPLDAAGLLAPRADASPNGPSDGLVREPVAGGAR